MTGAMLKVERARWWAISEQPFYGALAMRLMDVIDKSVDTAQTNGRTIRWNPQWVMERTDEEIRFVLIHETMHCAHQHLWRLPADKAGNHAGDHAINLTLQGVPGMTMPEGGLADPQYKGMAEEEIYARLQPPPAPPSAPEPAEQPQAGGEGQEQPGEAGSSPEDADGQGGGDAPAQDEPDPCGGFGPPADPADSAVAQAEASKDLQESWERAVMQAAQVAQATQGTLPGDLQRELERMRANRIDWRSELADFIRDAVSGRNDWSRSSRRHATAPVLYPKRRRDDLGVVLCARDTSGSITDALCATFTALIQQCADETGARVILVDCDSEIQAEYEIAPGEEVPARAKGGGGTDFRPVFHRADELADAGERIAGIVYLTDLYGTEPPVNDHPTLWLCTNNRVAASGRTVEIQI